MKVRVRAHDRIYCSECGTRAEEGEEVILIDDVTLCLSCCVEYLLAKIEGLERRFREEYEEVVVD